VQSPKKVVAAWLDRPQVTNREALVVGVIGGLLTAGLLYAAGALLSTVELVDFTSSIPVWLAAVVAGVMLAVGLVVGARKGSKAEELREQISQLESAR
jgi:ammonia channel protein AmtB